MRVKGGPRNALYLQGFQDGWGFQISKQRTRVDCRPTAMRYPVLVAGIMTTFLLSRGWRRLMLDFAGDLVN